MKCRPCLIGAESEIDKPLDKRLPDILADFEMRGADRRTQPGQYLAGTDVARSAGFSISTGERIRDRCIAQSNCFVPKVQELSRMQRIAGSFALSLNTTLPQRRMPWSRWEKIILAMMLLDLVGHSVRAFSRE